MLHITKFCCQIPSPEASCQPARTRCKIIRYNNNSRCYTRRAVKENISKKKKRERERDLQRCERASTIPSVSLRAYYSAVPMKFTPPTPLSNPLHFSLLFYSSIILATRKCHHVLPVYIKMRLKNAYMKGHFVVVAL
jgi:hypothetical protein